EPEALHERLAVQPDTAVRRAHAPQPEIAQDAVDDFAIAVEQRRLDVVESWRVGMPRSDGLQFDPAAPRGTRPSAYDIAVQRDGELDVAVPRHPEVDGAPFQIGCAPQAIAVRRRHRLP